MISRRLIPCLTCVLAPLLATAGTVGAEVDFSAYRPECGVVAKADGERLSLSWPAGGGAFGRVVLRTGAGKPLIEALGIAGRADGEFTPALADADPVASALVGTRVGTEGRPPGMSKFNEFFDNPAKRPSTRHVGALAIESVRVESAGRSAAVRVGGLAIGPLRGEWRITVFDGSPLVKVEAVVRTEADGVAFVYDAGLASEGLAGGRLAWTGTDGRPASAESGGGQGTVLRAVRHRAIAYEGKSGSLVATPPPHQFFFPRDYTTNPKVTWAGRGHHGDPRPGLGVRQDETGGGAFVPWFNAPPGTDQHLGFFLLMDRGRAEDGLKAMLAYTRGDRFAPLPGRITFSSHYHMAVAAAAMKARAEGREPEADPAFKRMFKAMNVQAVHLGEFHGDGHQYDPGPKRLPEMDAMFAECRRLSDDEFLLIPGEEVAKFLGEAAPGRHPGHWMSLFPRPVYWILDRRPDQPLVADDPDRGRVYRVGDAADVMSALEAEGGLAWTAHPRIKASAWAPDAFLDRPYFLSDRFLGAAWKAMPADLSRERLGERCLDLLDDLSNRGSDKQMPGEVDVFTLDETHELYGHMNVNYLKADRLPRYDDGWGAIVEGLRAGAFFTTTGEVLVPESSIDGAEGDVALKDASRAEVRFRASWTYPPAFAEIVSGDGKVVHRDRIDLRDRPAFGEAEIVRQVDLTGRRWVRLEVWDVAGNGAFTQPTRIEAK